MAKKTILLHIFFLFGAFSSIAQVGGKQIFTFLNNNPNPRLQGLGGANVSLYDRDINMFMANPALLNEQMHGFMSANMMAFYAQSQAHSIVYGHHLEKAGTFAAGLQFLDYNRIKQTDAAGNEIGTFTALDYAFNIAHARKVDNFRLGINAKYAGSRIAEFKAGAILADIGAVFKHPTHDFAIGMAIKNAGFQVRKYFETKEDLPLDVQLGASFKPTHMPFRFSVTAHHLHQLDIVYLDPKKTTGVLDTAGNPIYAEKQLGDKIMRHFIFGGELILSKSFNILISYNHMRRKEMRTDALAGLAGFSVGFLIKLREMEMGYSKSYYAVRGSTNNIYLSYNLSSIKKKKKIPNQENTEI
jgi:hypothetical protein